MTTPTLFLGVVFLVVFGATLLVLRQIGPDLAEGRLRRRLRASHAGAPDGSGWVETITRLTGPLSKLSVPVGDWHASPLRIRFMNAGLRAQATPTLFFAAKTLLTFALPAVLAVFVWATGLHPSVTVTTASLAVSAFVGYMVPNVALGWLAKRRQHEMFMAFPDALDLIRICVEAGLGLDAAIARVGRELLVQSPPLSEELHLMTLSIRAGSSREQALKDFALRTGVEEVDALTVVLVQADRFGTSIASSLRVHSDSLRAKRRQRAEEAAAKISTKLLMPLIFCVFPSLLLVLLGPAFVSVSRALLPTLGGTQ